MKRRAITLFTLILCCAFAHAQHKWSVPINYGIKGGFSSTFYEVHEFIVANMPINDYMPKSEISSFYTFFLRTNIKRHYLQTEVSYNISYYSIEFATDQWNSLAEAYEKSEIGTRIIGFEVPLFYGYHLRKEGPYGLSFYAGPKAKFVLTDRSRHTFDNSPYQHFEEHIRPINFSLMAGLAVNISRIFFDFALEYGLHNISNGFTTINLKDNLSTSDLVFNRRKNVFSFSVGFMF